MHGGSDGFDSLLGLVIGEFCRNWKSFTLSNTDPKQTLLPILRAFDFCGGFAFFFAERKDILHHALVMIILHDDRRPFILHTCSTLQPYDTGLYVHTYLTSKYMQSRRKKLDAVEFEIPFNLALLIDERSDGWR
jgi:hypothetical protein